LLLEVESNIVKFLLDKGANPESVSNDGNICKDDANEEHALLI